jgi:hypothetical protein
MFLLWTEQRTSETGVVECGRNFVVVLAIIDDNGVGGVVHESRHKWGVVERNFFRHFDCFEIERGEGGDGYCLRASRLEGARE